MNVLGYSERGVLTSVIFAIAHDPHSVTLLRDLLGRATFPYVPSLPKFDGAEILVEQSFSDFGDSDAVLLLNGEESEYAYSVFVEAKVKTSQGRFSLEKIFEGFTDSLSVTKNSYRMSSSLFTQLYFKQCLIYAIQNKRTNLSGFPGWSSKTSRDFGKNQVVARAIEKLRKHSDSAFYLMIVPDDVEDVCNFFHRSPVTPLPHQLSVPEVPWDANNYGYLTWKQVEDFCIDHGLDTAIRVFDFNRGQIY